MKAADIYQNYFVKIFLLFKVCYMLDFILKFSGTIIEVYKIGKYL